MKVLFLMFTFPNMNESFNMYTALVDQFYQHGHDVKVLAPTSVNGSTQISNEKDIDILRVKTLPLKNVPNYLKGISNILLPYQYERALYRYYPKAEYDLIIVPTPPITFVNLASKLKKKHNAKLAVILRDIFPQNAVDLGFIKRNSFLHRYFRKKEARLYETADSIGCMSQGNIDYVLANNANVLSNNLYILRNWQYPYKSFGYNKADLIAKFGIDGKFVVVFGGNIGKAQQLENVIALAKYCKKHEDVVILILGEGNGVDHIKKMATKNSLDNISFYKSIAKQEYQDLLTLCSIGLISLNKNFTIPNIPSKTIDYFNVGLPVLAFIDKATDYGIDLKEAEAGLWSYSGDYEQMYLNFDKLYIDPELRKKMSLRGKEYFNKYLTIEKAYNTVTNFHK